MKYKKDKFHMLSFIYGILKKNEANEFSYKTETDSRRRKETYGYRRKRVGGINLEFGINRDILYIKLINSKVLFYGTGNYIQYLVITYNGKESEIRHIYIYIYKICISESVCCTLAGEGSACNARDPILFLGWKYPLEKEQAAHSSILGLPWWFRP